MNKCKKVAAGLTACFSAFSNANRSLNINCEFDDYDCLEYICSTPLNCISKRMCKSNKLIENNQAPGRLNYGVTFANKVEEVYDDFDQVYVFKHCRDVLDSLEYNVPYELDEMMNRTLKAAASGITLIDNDTNVCFEKFKESIVEHAENKREEAFFSRVADGLWHDHLEPTPNGGTKLDFDRTYLPFVNAQAQTALKKEILLSILMRRVIGDDSDANQCTLVKVLTELYYIHGLKNTYDQLIRVIKASELGVCPKLLRYSVLPGHQLYLLQEKGQADGFALARAIYACKEELKKGVRMARKKSVSNNLRNIKEGSPRKTKLNSAISTPADLIDRSSLSLRRKSSRSIRTISNRTTRQRHSLQSVQDTHQASKNEEVFNNFQERFFMFVLGQLAHKTDLLCENKIFFQDVAPENMVIVNRDGAYEVVLIDADDAMSTKVRLGGGGRYRVSYTPISAGATDLNIKDVVALAGKYKLKPLQEFVIKRPSADHEEFYIDETKKAKLDMEMAAIDAKRTERSFGSLLYGIASTAADVSGFLPNTYPVKLSEWASMFLPSAMGSLLRRNALVNGLDHPISRIRRIFKNICAVGICPKMGDKEKREWFFSDERLSDGFALPSPVKMWLISASKVLVAYALGDEFLEAEHIKEAATPIRLKNIMLKKGDSNWAGRVAPPAFPFSTVLFGYLKHYNDSDIVTHKPYTIEFQGNSFKVAGKNGENDPELFDLPIFDSGYTERWNVFDDSIFYGINRHSRGTPGKRSSSSKSIATRYANSATKPCESSLTRATVSINLSEEDNSHRENSFSSILTEPSSMKRVPSESSLFTKSRETVYSDSSGYNTD